MSSIHGHGVLHMMEDHHYTEKSLLNAIIEKFGHTAKFHTCSQSDMSAQQLIEFLKARGKFRLSESHTLTVDSSKICNH